jgi:hypothetical protein
MATPPGMGSHIKRLKETPETAMTGTRWTPQEDEKLLLSITNGKTTNEIALEHQRTVGGIESRLRTIAVRMLDVDKTPIENVSATLRLSVEEILLAQKKATKPKKVPVKVPAVVQVSESESTLDVLKQIRDVLHLFVINSRQKPE